MLACEIKIKDTGLREACYSYLNSIKGLNIYQKEQSLLCSGLVSFCRQNIGVILGGTLSRFILDAWEEKKLKRLINESFVRFSPQQKEALFQKARELLVKESLEWGLFAGSTRYQRLESELIDYLSQSSYLDVDGFIRFRMGGYEEYLFAVLSIAADEILNEEEEQDYMTLLHEYLKGHATSAGCFHLILFRDGSYNLLKGKENLEVLEIIEGGREEGYEDSLIAALMNISPQKLVIHFEEGRRPGISAEVLKSIFKERILFCQGCKICRRGSGIV